MFTAFTQLALDAIDRAFPSLRAAPHRMSVVMANILSSLNALLVATYQAPTISPSSIVSNVCTVTIQVLNAAGNAPTSPVEIHWVLSDTAGGAASTTAPSSAVAATTGQLVITSTIHGTAGVAYTNASGELVLTVTQTAEHDYYLSASVAGQVSTSSEIEFPG